MYNVSHKYIYYGGPAYNLIFQEEEESYIPPKLILLSHFWNGHTDLNSQKYGVMQTKGGLPYQKTTEPTIMKLCISHEWIIRKITLLLSSMSALFPTSILLTLSEACCSMLRIQFLISEQDEKMALWEFKRFMVNCITMKTGNVMKNSKAEGAEEQLLLKDDSSVTSYTSKIPMAPR